MTAQKRTQSLQDVPYNISAIAGDALRGAGVISINSLTQVVPGLMNVDTLPAGSLGKLTFHADGSYRSSQTSNINPGNYYFIIPSAVIGNVRASLSPKENLTYSLFVRNVTNNPDISGGVNDQEFGNPYRLRNVGTPRTFGLGVRYKF